MSLEIEVEDRIRKLKELIDKGIDPFSEKKFEINTNSKELREKFEDTLQPGEERDERFSIAGRILSIREHGKIKFLDLYDEFGRIQIVLRKDRTNNFELHEFLDRGDILGIKGRVMKTKKGELSLLAEEFKILAKAIRPLPDIWFGLKDVEQRYRQRYVDLILNQEVKEIFKTSHRILKFIREYLDNRGYIEVFTPILQPIYGGAFAKPFKTYHNFLKEWRYLRIAPELYLKRLLVGGYTRVYEVAPCFRNESVDSNHNPEFIQLELYQAYSDFNDMMELVEDMLTSLVKNLFGSLRIKYLNSEIDFSKPWKRIKMVEAINSEANINLETMSEEELKNFAKKLGIIEERKGEIIEKLFDHFVKSKLINPTFITHFPCDITPLAKKADKNYAERFELYIGGLEVANAYTELNNPIEQYKRFAEEEKLRKELGNKELEYMPMDKDFVRALEYGMPPAGGLGIGLGRLAMILTNKRTLKEVLLFPTMSSKEEIKLVEEIFKNICDYYE